MNSQSPDFLRCLAEIDAARTAQGIADSVFRTAGELGFERVVFARLVADKVHRAHSKSVFLAMSPHGSEHRSAAEYALIQTLGSLNGNIEEGSFPFRYGEDAIIHVGGEESAMADGIAVPVVAADLMRGIVIFEGEVEADDDASRIALEALAWVGFSRASALNPIEWLQRLRQRHGTLTPRERECLGLAAKGRTDAEIGDILGISPHTAFAHIKSATQKLGAGSRAQAVLHAMLTSQLRLN